MTIPPIITFALSAAIFLRYPIIGIGAFVEGPVVMIAVGFLARHNVVALVPAFIALVIGDLIADAMWYGIGRHGAEPIIRKKGQWLGVSAERLDKLKNLFLNHQTKILFISKLTLGFGIAKGVLMAAGASRVSFKKFLLINLCGELVLVCILLSIGYLFGETYTVVADDVRPWFVVGILIAVVAVLAIVTRIARKRWLNGRTMI